MEKEVGKWKLKVQGWVVAGLTHLPFYSVAQSLFEAHPGTLLIPSFLIFKMGLGNPCLIGLL